MRLIDKMFLHKSRVFLYTCVYRSSSASSLLLRLSWNGVLRQNMPQPRIRKTQIQPVAEVSVAQTCTLLNVLLTLGYTENGITTPTQWYTLQILIQSISGCTPEQMNGAWQCRIFINLCLEAALRLQVSHLIHQTTQCRWQSHDCDSWSMEISTKTLTGTSYINWK